MMNNWSVTILLLAALLTLNVDGGILSGYLMNRSTGCPATIQDYKNRAQGCQSPFRSLRPNPTGRQVCRKFKESEPCMKRLHSECSTLRQFVNTPEYQMRQELRQIC